MHSTKEAARREAWYESDLDDAHTFNIVGRADTRPQRGRDADSTSEESCKSRFSPHNVSFPKKSTCSPSVDRALKRRDSSPTVMRQQASIGERAARRQQRQKPKIHELAQVSPESGRTSGCGNSPPLASGAKHPELSSRAAKPPPPQKWKPLMQSSSNTEYSGMLLQPDSSPISEEQLAAEIQGIYDGVVTVELKCIDIDAALARDTHTQLGLEQWQALIALHRTLLYEHHDFLMATKHPSASDNLRALATKYSMPARMWKHGIHAFLEVLRHRRPDSQDYTLAFVVLAYQMMALLMETVPAFEDTWIECLGDLARYRMAIEDDREMHAAWGGLAARWYTLASDRHPEIGRLYHHLAVLERPSMRKFSSYARSLTCLCSSPFLNARDSVATFCAPIVQEVHPGKAFPDRRKSVVYSHVAAAATRGNPYLEYAVFHLDIPEQSATSKIDATAERPLHGEPLSRYRRRELMLSDKLTKCSFGHYSRRSDETLQADPDIRKMAGTVVSDNVSASQMREWSWTFAVQRILSLLSVPFGRMLLLPLLLSSCVPAAMGLPLTEPIPELGQDHSGTFIQWVLPLLPLAVGLLRAVSVLRKPIEELKISYLWTNFDIGSAGAYLVVRSVNEAQTTANMFVLGCWCCFWLISTATRYRLTAAQYQDRYLPAAIFAGALAAFALGTFISMRSGGLSAHNLSVRGLNLLPLGWSASAWLCFIAWRDPRRGDTAEIGQTLNDGRPGSTALELSPNSHGSRDFMRSLWHRGNVSVDNPWLEEQPSVRHPAL